MPRKESFVVIILSILSAISATPLDDYVNAPDPTFSWKLLQTIPSSDNTIYILNMTSQTWKDSSFSSQPIWWHYMVVTVPKVLRRGDKAFMLISSGANTDAIPTTSWTSNVSLAVGSVAVELKQIPNQPIIFKADPRQQSRKEDAVIAWTWKTFMENNATDPYVLLRMPMTKAVVRGMDATQQFLRQLAIQVPEKFIVGGLSKRGWTTWTTAAVDNQRVIGAFPIVMDMVNLHKNMMNHYQSLAGWTFDFYDYYVENVTSYFNSPYFQSMANIIDPYVYFERYHRTKIVQFQAADDEFFLPNSEDFFWNDLQKATGGSHLLRIPNVGHSIKGYQDTLTSFYMSICDNAILPSWTWTRTTNETHGQIVATVSITSGHPIPTSVTAYQARTVPGTKRDFRLSVLDPAKQQVVPNPIKWNEQTNVQIEKTSESIIYTYTTPMPPEQFWDAAFIQVTFPGPEHSSVNLTTETLILPNTYPVGPCEGSGCYGTLV